jgi:hypothetical protein
VGKLNKNELGFTAVEAMLIVLILAVIGFGGYYVYHTNHKTKTTVTSNTANKMTSSSPNSTKSTTSKPESVANLYAGWDTYCSKFGGLCLKYPSNWILKTTVEPVSNSLNTHEANIMSPSGNVVVQYQPYCTELMAPAPGTYTDDILSVTSPSSNSNFKIVEAISSYQGSSSSNISENLYLTSTSVVTQNNITPGVQTNTTGITDEATAGFFMNSKSTNPSNLQCINVGSLNNSTGSNYLNFSTTSAAQAWFGNSEVKTAVKILSSVNYL